jgi:hypothetical protein
MRRRLRYLLLLAAFTATAQAADSSATEPPAINPFGSPPIVREDALPGYLRLSNGEIHAGLLFLARDKRFHLFDETLQRQREIPLAAVKRIECRVKKEWLEKEYRFKELTSDEKVYTGRSYPAREYEHVLTLHDGGTISGGLAEIVYLQPRPEGPRAGSGVTGGTETAPLPPQIAAPLVATDEPRRFLLHKRQKGELGTTLDSLVYVRLIKLGEDAYAEAQKLIAGQRQGQQGKPKDKSSATKPSTKPRLPPAKRP